jgi:hypothetical protein
MAKTGPGRSKKSSGSSGRTTTPTKHKGANTGRYVSAEERGRYTAPVPRDVEKSPRWFGPLILTLLIGGVLVVALNYLNELPGAVSPWYLLVGLLAIFSAFYLATKYK